LAIRLGLRLSALHPVSDRGSPPFEIATNQVDGFGRSPRLALEEILRLSNQLFDASAAVSGAPTRYEKIRYASLTVNAGN
jgi:hypothetical protein